MEKYNTQQAHFARARQLQSRIVISINTAWNIANFRAGLIRALVSAGYEVIAISPHDEHVDRLTDLGCRFLPLGMDNKGTNPIKDFALFLRYMGLLRRERPAAFLGYTIKPNIYGSLAARVWGIPVINNVSGLGTAFIRDTWMTLVVKRLYRLALWRSQTVFFQNNEDRQLFVDNKLVRTSQTALLPGSGIDLNRFKPCLSNESVTPRAGARFLLIARLLSDKGVNEFVEAARRVKARNSDATFALLGFIDAENRTAISRAQVTAWVDEGVIDYLGSSTDVRPHIAGADCVVLPSYREGTPRSLLEAAAMGKPLIATDVPGCREVVEHHVNGLLCKVRDAGDLAARMLEFLALPRETRDGMGRAGRAKMEREFDEQIVIDRYLAAIASACGRRELACEAKT